MMKMSKYIACNLREQLGLDYKATVEEIMMLYDCTHKQAKKAYRKYKRMVKHNQS